jgi:hypothetical protein
MDSGQVMSTAPIPTEHAVEGTSGVNWSGGLSLAPRLAQVDEHGGVTNPESYTPRMALWAGGSNHVSALRMGPFLFSKHVLVAENCVTAGARRGDLGHDSG